MKETTKEAPSVTDIIAKTAASGYVGHIKVQKTLLPVYRVEAQGNRVWFFEGETGLNLNIQSSRTSLGLIAQNLVSSKHVQLGYNYKVVDVASKWVEQNFLTLAASVKGVSEYRGQIMATRLDAVCENRASNQSPAEMIGLTPTEADGKSERLYNVDGSEPYQDKTGEFNRVVRGQYADMFFNTHTGQYAVIKDEAECADLYAPLLGMQAAAITDAEICEGLDSAPPFQLSEVLGAGMLAGTR